MAELEELERRLQRRERELEAVARISEALYTRANLDDMMTKAVATKDPAARAKIYQQIQLRLNSEGPFICWMCR